MKTHFFFLMFLSFVALTSGCGRPAGFHAEEIPSEMLHSEDLEEKPLFDDSEEELSTGVDSSRSSSESESESGSGNQAQSNQLGPGTKPPRKKALTWASVMPTARWVLQNEGRQVGRACNFYVQRVFEWMGFGRANWRANDFDQYVRSHFSAYQVKTFSTVNLSTERSRLKDYLWSFPERTGFVLQWKRNARYGHVAFVQRIGDQLVIYHASLNRFPPKSQRATVEALLYKNGGTSSLRVFSHLKK